MPKPYYTTQEEKDRFFEEHRAFYQRLEYTEEDIDRIIEEKKKDTEMDREYETAQVLTKYLQDSYRYLERVKYTSFTPSMSQFGRVAQAMYKPETSLENIQYNELMTRKLSTQQGRVEVLQDAMTLLATVDPRKVARVGNDASVVSSEYNPLMLGFITTSLCEAVKHMKKANLLDETSMPDAVIRHVEACKSFFEEFSEVENQGKMTTSIHHLLMPKDITLEQLDKVLKNFPEKDKPGMIQYVGTKGNKAIDTQKYREPEDKAVCEAFYQRSLQRMARERKDYEAAAQQYGAAEEFLCDTVGISLRNTRYETRNDEICKNNDRQIEDRKPALFEKAKALYGKSPAESADEVLKTLKAGQRSWISNPNYDRMVSAVQRVKELAGSSPVDSAVMRKELEQLDMAARDYLGKKLREHRAFSELALDRIDAARLVTAFVKGRCARLALDENVKLKEDFAKKEAEAAAKRAAERADKMYTAAEAREEFETYAKKFAGTHSPEDFARARAMGNVYRELTKENTMAEKAGAASHNAVMSARDVDDLTEVNVKMYSELRAMSVTFRKALMSGDMRTAEAGMAEAVRELNQPKAEPEAPRREAAAQRDVNVLL